MRTHRRCPACGEMVGVAMIPDRPGMKNHRVVIGEDWYHEDCAIQMAFISNFVTAYMLPVGSDWPA